MKFMKSHIAFIITGGTIDSRFDEITESIQVNPQSNIKSYIDSLSLHIDTSFHDICLKDSRALNQYDVLNILRTIQQSTAECFIVTHGTYTMPDTARFLAQHADSFSDKTVVLTGSMKPLRGFNETDAPFNLGFAMACALQSAPGVYLAMNGKLFQPENVFKNIQKARFETLAQ